MLANEIKALIATFNKKDESRKYTLNKEELMKWLNNTAIFLGPAALIFLGVLQAGGSLQMALIALETWALSTAIDLIRKFLEGR